MSPSFNTVRNLLSENISSLKEEYPIESIGIFGSITRNDFDTEKSDVDLIVEFNGEIGYGFIELAEKLEKLLNRKVDLVSKRALKPRHWDYLKSRIIYI